MATGLRTFERPIQSVLPLRYSLAPTVEDEYSVVSMFSGCGGMDLGFLGGFKIDVPSSGRGLFRGGIFCED
jgi:hypothetical protein